MTSSASSPAHLSHSRACRIVRNPALLLVIALVYAACLLVFPSAGDGLRFMALRGSTAANDASEVAPKEAAQNWEPEKRNPGTSYGVSARGPVKGGVEIYPVQVRLFLPLDEWNLHPGISQFLTTYASNQAGLINVPRWGTGSSVFRVLELYSSIHTARA